MRPRTTHGEKFVKSGERTDNANGQIQDRSRILNGSIVSPPTNPKTKNCDEYSIRSAFCDLQRSVIRVSDPLMRLGQGLLPGTLEISMGR